MGKLKKPKQIKKNSLLKTDLKLKAAPLAAPTESKSRLTESSQTADSEEDPFLSLKLNLDDLFDIPKESRSDDVRRKLSYKSVKSNKATNTIKRKEKLNLKRKLLLKKIDVVNQMEKELKVRDKRRKTALIGDTNPLHDALPSLESLKKTKSNISLKPSKVKGPKFIEKAKQRKKKLVDDISVFKRVLKNKTFKSNPFDAISSHIQAIVEMDKKTVKK